MANHSMKVLEYKLRFLSPAFLGNAEQNGQWRTPPFKALLRQWWRVAYAANRKFHFDLEKMRHEEGLLFGHAWLKDDTNERGQKIAARKSLVRMRLDSLGGSPEQTWGLGSQHGVAPLSTGLDTSYAWFGLIRRGNGLSDRTGIKSGTAEGARKLQIALPDEHAPALEETLALVNAFGLLGSRSRGGWGALQVDGVPLIGGASAKKYARTLDVCLKSDWPMSLAKDTKGLLIWESTDNFESWDKAMRFIAIQRKIVRTALKNGKDLRQVLGFALPNSRMPSPLRWKIMAEQQKLTVRIFAMPHTIPNDAGKSFSEQNLQAAWSIVTKTLDNIQTLQRI